MPTFAANADEYSGKPLWDTSLASAIIGTACIALFYIFRWRRRTAKGLHFWCLLPLAYVFCLSQSVLSMWATERAGVGRHLGALTREQIKSFLQYLKAMDYTNCLSITFTRIALLSLYLQHLPPSQRTHRILVKVTIGFVAATGVAGILLTSLICRPISAWWNLSGEDRCGNILLSYRMYSIPNIAASLAIIFIMLFSIRRPDISRLTKICSMSISTLLSVGIATSLVRVLLYHDDMDFTYTHITPQIMMIAEPEIYLVAACLPAVVLSPIIPNSEVAKQKGKDLEQNNPFAWSNRVEMDVDNVRGELDAPAVGTVPEIGGRERARVGELDAVSTSRAVEIGTEANRSAWELDAAGSPQSRDARV
ncbi:hypothetical protein BDV96DRAFT_640320 [Lophiotrema nucula]|uniref:Rhodopsin domain-containing protein n=1 Tax=Lophiotrema nucula TaxID=690887 RepID=A0A6A5ZSP8_9PLEO|nr:hypothetical protein BDV96DRAFT_640320 [Lophiotrema nucula]